MKPPRVIVVIPARDEAEAIARVVGQVKVHSNWDILVVDDASTDATMDQVILSGAGLISLPFQLGAWGAIQTGLRFALHQGYDIAVTMDADGQHLADSLHDVGHPVVTGNADVSIGICPARLSPARRFACDVFRIVTGLTSRDPTSGLRAYGKSSMTCLLDQQAAMLDYQDIGVLMMLREHNLSVTEVPVEMQSRVSGHSRVFYSWSRVISYLTETLILTFTKWRPSWFLREAERTTVIQPDSIRPDK